MCAFVCACPGGRPKKQDTEKRKASLCEVAHNHNEPALREGSRPNPRLRLKASDTAGAALPFARPLQPRAEEHAAIRRRMEARLACACFPAGARATAWLCESQSASRRRPEGATGTHGRRSSAGNVEPSGHKTSGHKTRRCRHTPKPRLAGAPTANTAKSYTSRVLRETLATARQNGAGALRPRLRRSPCVLHGRSQVVGAARAKISAGRASTR